MFMLILQKLITDLPTNMEYKLSIAAVTQSIFSTSYYIGDFSKEIIFQLEGKQICCLVIL